jgi:hypothetical protein
MLFGACGRDAAPGAAIAGAPSVGLSPKRTADALFAVMSADRAVYATEVVHRLQNEKQKIKATERFREEDTLPLPAQMFRMGAERVTKADQGVSYALLSLWPVNKQNAPRTEVERTGLQAVADSGKSHYADETIRGKRYFTAIYPDKAVSAACVTCHNDHNDSPRSDFKEGDIMGGVVIRIALDGGDQ